MSKIRDPYQFLSFGPHETRYGSVATSAMPASGTGASATEAKQDAILAELIKLNGGTTVDPQNSPAATQTHAIPAGSKVSLITGASGGFTYIHVMDGATLLGVAEASDGVWYLELEDGHEVVTDINVATSTTDETFTADTTTITSIVHYK